MKKFRRIYSHKKVFFLSLLQLNHDFFFFFFQITFVYIINFDRINVWSEQQGLAISKNAYIYIVTYFFIF